MTSRFFCGSGDFFFVKIQLVIVAGPRSALEIVRKIVRKIADEFGRKKKVNALEVALAIDSRAKHARSL